TSVTEMGGIIFPPLPAFYHHPQTLDDMVDHTVARVLELFDIHVPGPHWDGIAPQSGQAAPDDCRQRVSGLRPGLDAWFAPQRGPDPSNASARRRPGHPLARHSPACRVRNAARSAGRAARYRPRRNVV